MAVRQKKLSSAPSVKVEVTREIINRSVPRDSGHCMIADAVSAAFKGATHASADVATIRFSDPDKGLRYTYLTPRMVQERLLGFDLGIKPEPFSFQLRAGHTTRMKRQRAPGDNTERTRTQAPSQRAGLDIAHSISTGEPLRGKHDAAKERRAYERAKMVNPEGHDHIPEVRGGTPPPTGALAGGAGIPKGRRRQYGLRAMDRYSAQLREQQPQGE